MNWMKFPVVMELGKVFSNSCRLIVKSPNALIHSFVYTIFLEAVSTIDNDTNLSTTLGCFRLVLIAVLFYWSYVLSNYFIFHVYKMTGMADGNLDVFRESRDYFWDTVLQSLLGIFITGLILILFLGFGFITFGAYGVINFIPFMLGLYLIALLSFGAAALGKRIMLDKKAGIIKGTVDGIKVLGLHWTWYFCFYLAFTFASILVFWAKGILGLWLTGVDIFSIPVFPIYSFLETYSLMSSYLGMRIIFGLIDTVTLPFFSFLTTFAYISRRKYEI
ncbi:MAG: hypothetical protein JNM55_15335 [Anaerolineales bacterium]|nr:hypothetical protein [Anaerolineales bacterium]